MPKGAFESRKTGQATANLPFPENLRFMPEVLILRVMTRR
jgi:hypothetical protein